MLNNEPRNTFWYGWIITQLDTTVDLAGDAAKPYANTDITRVHIDNNIITPNNYYNITFYVQGNGTVYHGMLGSAFNVIYIGIPPQGGTCFVTPAGGIASVTEFNFVTGNWKDPDGIAEFHFSYSFDGGVTYFPISSDLTKSSIHYTFQPIFSP